MLLNRYVREKEKTFKQKQPEMVTLEAKPIDLLYKRTSEIANFDRLTSTVKQKFSPTLIWALENLKDAKNEN